MEFKERLYQLRMQKNISQEKLAEQLNVSRQTVTKWELGQSLPEIEKLITISHYFGVTIDHLIKPSDYDYIPTINSDRLEFNPLISFLLEAKKNTYAAHKKEDTPSRPKSHDISYEDGDYLYIDSYLGSHYFSGQEAIWFKHIPQWTMNYIGKVYGQNWSGDFLREALSLVPKQHPYRGPQIYQNGAYTYHNTINGTFDWFSGYEEIFYENEKIYECQYHGGLIK